MQIEIVHSVHENSVNSIDPMEVDSPLHFQSVQASCERLGWKVSSRCVATIDDSLASDIKASNPNLIYNMVRPRLSNGKLAGWVSKTIESLGIPFVGPSAEYIAQASDKHAAKILMRVHALPTPDWFAYGEALYEFRERLPSEFIFKSRFEHGSLDISDASIEQAESVPRLKARLDYWSACFGRPYIAEKYIDGREFTVSVLGDHLNSPRLLPTVSLDFTNLPRNRRPIVGFDAKWNSDSTEFRNVRRNFALSDLDRPALKKMAVQAETCWQIFSLRHFATIDFRIDRRGQPTILEVNAAPSLSPNSILAEALHHAEMPLERVFEAIAQTVSK